jgi:hypothetical protein
VVVVELTQPKTPSLMVFWTIHPPRQLTWATYTADWFNMFCVDCCGDRVREVVRRSETALCPVRLCDGAESAKSCNLNGEETDKADEKAREERVGGKCS